MKIAVIQLTKMGDLLQSVPLLKKLKLKYPAAEITLIHSELFHETAQKLPVDELMPVNLDRLFLKNGDGYRVVANEYSAEVVQTLKNFDLIVNLNSSSALRELLGNLTERKICGFYGNDEWSNNWLNFNLAFIKSRNFSTINLVDIFSNIIAGKNPGNFSTNDKSENKTVVIQLGSRSKKRQYPLALCADIADKLIDKGYSVKLTGSVEERVLVARFMEMVRNPYQITDYVGKTSISELFKIIESSGHLITTDTGTMHIAAHLKIPVTAIFTGPAYPFETLGYSSAVRAFIPDRNKYRCYPCQEETECPYNFGCQHSISPCAIVKSILGDVETLKFYRTDYDEIGQFLIPNATEKKSESEVLSYLNRIFALKEFCSVDKQIIYYFPDNDNLTKVTKSLITDLSRELKIMNFLSEKGENIWDKKDSFHYILPLMYMQKLAPNSNLPDKYRLFLMNIDEIINK
ncbi:MAG: glycosyltransferase family 9 protein [Candidatus Cloacimonetes bacterium]|nr:glycosyltransferase family 9 protein [Candidatus Cloacimonadota bacterium]